MSLGCRLKIICLIILVTLATSFCTSKNFLVINYQLPSETVTVKDSAVSIVFEDQRTDLRLVSKSAKMALKDFSGNFALIVARDKTDERLVGAFSLNSMLKTIFKQRLESAGLQVASDDQDRQTVLEIILKEFKLDLVNRKWIVHISYQANLLKQNRFVTGQTITGNAERLRVVGSKDAEKVIGELITDAVNRLDLDELFQTTRS